ncbi:hypothetical protein X274_09525 [Marinitoga sp. 1155]|uniref:hypothetical protein n=1 Tax=Marinitoga sp. 1154 TaxID=1643335 RepID=UPI000640BD37|nr:hypothetical protein [Marinitoga sp. 1154]KLO21904.1 hypothetical protein X274_09525 [Marinitoga sp. 1155]NUU98927.1 hypothetical protein [Marinitoga sp. 1154]
MFLKYFFLDFQNFYMLLAGKFDPQIVKKRQRYILAIEDMVLFLYSKDLSIRDYVKDISAIIN